jgi:hypothetical protein
MCFRVSQLHLLVCKTQEEKEVLAMSYANTTKVCDHLSLGVTRRNLWNKQLMVQQRRRHEEMVFKKLCFQGRMSQKFSS